MSASVTLHYSILQWHNFSDSQQVPSDLAALTPAVKNFSDSQWVPLWPGSTHSCGDTTSVIVVHCPCHLAAPGPWFSRCHPLLAAFSLSGCRVCFRLAAFSESWFKSILHAVCTQKLLSQYIDWSASWWQQLHNAAVNVVCRRRNI